ncbi:MAG TPA: hypothetical protein VFO66_09105 [Gemmatimonadaceae bacterium]|nr:hypothetical protein [Gemmatimonadaceae bacterium]
MNSHWARWVVPLVAVLACGDHSATGPQIQDRSVTTLVVVSGNDQMGQSENTLETPLVVRALDGLGAPIAGLVLAWVPTREGGVSSGSVFAGVSVTDSDGKAQEWWTLGAVGTNTLEVRSVNSSTGERKVWAKFTAQATSYPVHSYPGYPSFWGEAVNVDTMNVIASWHQAADAESYEWTVRNSDYSWYLAGTVTTGVISPAYQRTISATFRAPIIDHKMKSFCVRSVDAAANRSEWRCNTFIWTLW